MAQEIRPSVRLPRAREIWSRRKWLALGMFAGVLAVLLTIVATLPPLYRARATVLVDRDQVPEAFVRSPITAEVETRLSTISQEVLSRERLQALIERYNLYPGLRKSGAIEGALEEMRKDILLEPKIVEQSGGKIATVGFGLTYRGADPQTVTDVTNALAALYVERNSKLREKQASGTAEFLKAQLTEMKGKIDEMERRVGHAPMPIEAEVASLERLNMRLRVVSDRQLRAMDRRERVLKEAEEGPAAAAEPGARVAPESASARLAKLKRELAELKTRYTDKYPDVIRVKAEIAALEQHIATAPPEPATGTTTTAPAHSRKSPLAELDAELRALKDEERMLQGQIASLERRAEEAPRRQTEFQRQTRDLATTKDFYQTLLKRYEDAQIAESMEQGQRAEQFRVLDQAVVPKQPFAPNRPRLIAVALGLAAGLAVAAALLRERLDTSFHTVDDLRGFSRVPVIVGIPTITTKADVARRRRHLGLATASYAVGLAVVVGASYVLARGSELLTRVLSGI